MADRRTGPPSAPITRLVEAYVHGEDARRAVGLTGLEAYATPLVAEALLHQARTSRGLGGGRERVAGLRLITDDADLVIGEGAEVRGRALSLLLAVSGRPVADGELRGPGAGDLRRGLGTWDSGQLWQAAHVERAALAQDLEELSGRDWQQPSLCGQWTVEEVVAHLVAAASLGRIAWLRSVLGARFDFDLHNQRRLEEQRGPTPADTLARLRAVVGSTTAPIGDTAAWLGEVIVHAEDIRQALGIGNCPDPGAVVQVARFYAARDFTVPSRTAIEGLRVEADDAAFAVGDPAAELIRGPVLALVMVMVGRASHLEQLEGPGVTTLAARLAWPPVSPAGE